MEALHRLSLSEGQKKTVEIQKRKTKNNQGLAQTSTKRRNILVVSIIIVVLIVSSIAALIAFYRQPSNAKHVPTTLNLNVSMNQTNVIQGGNLQAEVNVTSIGNAENITLGCYADPIGIGCGFAPAMGPSNFTSLLTINVPNSTPTSNYSVIITALGASGITQNVSYTISVLSANVTVSGGVSLGGAAVIYPTQIQFQDAQTNRTYTSIFPLHAPFNFNQNYTISLQNEHNYKVTISYKWGNEEIQFPATYAAGNFYVFAPAGNTSITKDFSKNL